MLGHGGNRNRDLWDTSPMLCQLWYDYFVCVGVLHSLPHAGHFVLPPWCGNLPPQKKHFFVLSWVFVVTLVSYTSSTARFGFLTPLSILVAWLSAISCALANSRASCNVCSLLNNCRRILFDFPLYISCNWINFCILPFLWEFAKFRRLL
jgi:hypothetical protein